MVGNRLVYVSPLKGKECKKKKRKFLNVGEYSK